ncbi:MAG TPA: hypothetical protein VK961_23320 [Chthoniobacter sp.]|nr:hypothetical protein [Chthoniobacter sp.]
MVTIFLFSLFAAAAVLRRFLPFPQIDGIEPKLAWLALHGARYDTLFVGSSRVYDAVVPQEFDAAMTGAGRPTRSFNLAYKGMRPPENSYVLDHALAEKRPWRFVIVEADEIPVKIRREVEGTRRGAYWCDLRRMQAVAEQVIGVTEGDRGWSAYWRGRRALRREMPRHLIPFLFWATNLGRGDVLLRSEDRDWDRWLGDRRDGYTDDSHKTMALSDVEEFVSTWRPQDDVSRRASEASQQLFAEMERQIVNSGGQMILLIPPRFEKGSYLPDPKRFPHLAVLDFSDPRRYPELYEASHRADPDHLNVDGALIFTRLLATRLNEALALEGR